MPAPDRSHTRLPHPVSTAMLSRAASSLSLNPASTRPTKDPLVQPVRHLPISSTVPTIVPSTSKQQSGLPTSSKSTVNLRPPASTQLALRPSSLQPKTAPVALTPADQVPRKPIGLRKVSSTHFKENFFAPLPGVPPMISRGEKGALMKKKSQISLSRPVPSSTRPRIGSSGRDTTKMGTDARTVIVEVTPEKGSVYGVGHPRSRGLQVDHNPFAPHPSPPRPPPVPLRTTKSRPDLHTPRSETLPSAIPAHLLSSPWKGPRISIEQIKDTEFSFTEEDSIDLSSGLSRNAVLSRSTIISNGHESETPIRASGSSRVLLVSSDGEFSSGSQPQAPTLECETRDLIEEKEKEIRMLKMELSVERQMLGRLGREAADKIQAAREVYEAGMLSMAEEVQGIKREMVRRKYEVVERAAQELLGDIEAQKAMIKRLKGMLIA